MRKVVEVHVVEHGIIGIDIQIVDVKQPVKIRMTAQTTGPLRFTSPTRSKEDQSFRSVASRR